MACDIWNGSHGWQWSWKPSSSSTKIPIKTPTQSTDLQYLTPEKGFKEYQLQFHK